MQLNNNNVILNWRSAMRNLCHVLLFALIIVPTGCKKFVEIDPPKTQIISAAVYTNDETATGAIRGIYSEMMGNSTFISGGFSSITVLTGLSADEFINYFTDPEQEAFYESSLRATNGTVNAAFWGPAYQFIYHANSVIEGLGNSTGVTAATKKHLEGEAKFVRAFCHFYLVSLFGDVPLITITDFRVNSLASRTPAGQVYQQIIADLKDAQNLLDDNYITTERVRPNKWAATALLARVYLYTQDWVNAETQAATVINNTTYSLESDLNNVFLANSSEAIWQLMPVFSGLNTWEGIVFIPDPGSAPYWVSLSSELVGAFEPGDNRLTNWVGNTAVGTDTYYYPFKYKKNYDPNVTEYSMVLRLAEQYLIRAEARAKQNNISGAQADLNVIRNRAGLSNTTVNTQAELLAAIEQERRIEFFAEGGHRWLDLKRTGRADAALGSMKPGWQSTDALYPIPQSEIQKNPSLTQNPGY